MNESNRSPQNKNKGWIESFKNAIGSFYRRVNKLFDRIVFNKAGSLIVSLMISLVICVVVDYQDIRYELFDNTSTTVNLGNVDVNILSDQEQYEVSGIPNSVQVTLTGNAAEIQVYRQQHTNLSVTADLRPYEEGSFIIDLSLDDLPSSIEATLSPSSVTATITAKKERSFTVDPEILIGSGQRASDFKTPTLSSSTVKIRATEDELNAIRFVRAIVDVSGFTNGNQYTTEATVVAYDAEGNRVQVEIDPSSIEATVEKNDTDTE